MIVGLPPQTRLLLLRPLLLASLAAVLQLAHEGKDVVLPELKTLRVHELALVTSAIAALEPHRGGEVEDVLGSCPAQTLEVFWSCASPSVCLLLLLVLGPLSDPLQVVTLHLPRGVPPHLRHLSQPATREVCYPLHRPCL